ncbi:MAG: type IX secretion system membrane protein PorP/SprF [Bacteroidia bacterium]|nr:type IX secretion system membrane protein PorP/SprF [Bacteroidia bacterium]
MRKRFFILFNAFLLSASAQHLELLSGANTEAFLFNPAAAGEKGYLAFTAGRRYQWLGFDGAPKNLYVSLHTPLISKKVNLGFLYVRDEIGIFTRNRLQAAYAFRMKMGKWNAALGLNAGVSAGRSAWSGVALNQNPDVAFPLTDSRFLFPEAGAGIQLYHPVFHFNFSTQNLLPQEQLSRTSYPSYTTSAEWFIKRPQITWSLLGMVRHLHHSPVQYEFQWKGTFSQAFTIGAGYRMGDALLLMAGFKINRQIYLYYSYENGLTPLADQHTGSHEILFRYEFGYPVRSEDPRTAQ